MQSRYWTTQNGVETVVHSELDGEIGRVLEHPGFFDAKHSCRHRGGVFKSLDHAIEYVISVDERINRLVVGQSQPVEVAA